MIAGVTVFSVYSAYTCQRVMIGSATCKAAWRLCRLLRRLTVARLLPCHEWSPTGVARFFDDKSPTTREKKPKLVSLDVMPDFHRHVSVAVSVPYPFP